MSTKRIKPMVTCPSCKKEFMVQRVPKLKDTRLTVKLTLEKGHMLQAETLGGTLVNIAKLLKAQARELGGKVTVLVGNLQVESPDVIAIELVVLTNPTKPHAEIANP